VLAVGAQIPDVSVFTAPGETTTLAELVREGPALFLFYLLDWSGT
jgi:peroxiredoxin